MGPGRDSAALANWDEWLRDRHENAIDVCIGFALDGSPAERVVVGVDDADQLERIIRAASCESPGAPPVAGSEPASDIAAGSMHSLA